MYKLAIFDMDGTILDTIQDLANGVNHALTCMGMPTRTVEYVRSIVGNGIRTTLTLCAPQGITEDELNSLHEAFTPFYEKHRTDNTGAYAGVKELLQKLRKDGIKTAVISNKSDESVKALCVEYFDGLFDMPRGLVEGVPKKPAPDSVNTIIEKFGVEKSEAVYIGDSEVDVQTAKNAGIDGIFVTWGFRGREQLKENGAVVIADNTEEVYILIKQQKGA
ncbi:MAG: HAD family hydrolase [Firmicutes bacterium]|nr:HAD family hydrolase [Bacillota bacterium]